MAKNTAPPSVPVEEQPYQVPDNWRWTYIGNLVTVIRGVSFGKDDAHKSKQENDVLILRGGNIEEGYIDTNTDNVYVNASFVSENQYVKKDDVIIVASTGSKQVIGRAGISERDYEDVSFGAFLILVRPTKSANSRFIDFYFQSVDYRNRIRDLATGININNIRLEYITRTVIPFPPLPEQRRIVERLESLFTKLDEARDKAQAVLDGYEYRRAAILQKAFAGELTAQWRAKHGISLDNWKTVRLCDVCAVNPPRAAVKNLPDTLAVSFVPMSAVSAETGTVAEYQTRPLQEVRNGFPNFSEGDILFAKITPCMENGKSALVGKLVNGIGYGSTEFYVIRCGEELYNRLLFHLVRGSKFRAEAKAVMTGSVGQMRTPRKFMEQYEIPLPSKAEQEQIVLLLDTLFEKEQQTKDAAERVLESVGLIKKAILGRAFRGLLGTNRPEEPNMICP